MGAEEHPADELGLLTADEEALRAVLAQRVQEFIPRIEGLSERVEFNVKAAWYEEAVLRGILGESELLRRLNETTEVAAEPTRTESPSVSNCRKR